MYIDPVVLGVAVTVGGECVLIVLVLALSLWRYTRKSGLTLGSILKAAQSVATVWSEDKTGK